MLFHLVGLSQCKLHFLYVTPRLTYSTNYLSGKSETKSVANWYFESLKTLLPKAHLKKKLF